MSRRKVSAAGGVVWRRDAGGAVEVLLVHRPRYDDWSLPKGKVDGDESLEECALREVREETGYRCRLGPHLDVVRYEDGKGRDKTVDYWAMTPEDGTFTPGTEVDGIRWLPASEAAGALSYERDRDLVAALVQVVTAT